MAVLTDPRYQALRDLAAADLGAGFHVRAAILAQFASEKTGEWPPQDNNPGNVHVNAMCAVGQCGLPSGIGDGGAVALFPSPDAGAHGYGYYIGHYGPASGARTAIANDDGQAYINAVVGFGYATSQQYLANWNQNYQAALAQSPPPPPAGPTPTSLFSPAFVSGVGLARALGTTFEAPPWAASQGLTIDHLGTVPDFASGGSYLADAVYRLAVYAKGSWVGGNREIALSGPGAVAGGATDPAQVLSPLYVAVVECAHAMETDVSAVPWAAAQGLTPDHFGHPPDLATGAAYLQAQLDGLDRYATAYAGGGGSGGSGGGSGGSGGGSGGSGGAGGGSGGSGGGSGGSGGSGGGSGGGGGTSGPTPNDVYDQPYVEAVRLIQTIGGNILPVPWAGAQGLTPDHLGTVPTWHDGANYLASLLYVGATYAKDQYAKGVPGAALVVPNIVSAASDPTGTNAPSATIMGGPIYVGVIDMGRALGGSFDPPGWSGADGAHWGTPPDIATASLYLTTAIDQLYTFVTGELPPGGGSGGGGGGGTGGSPPPPGQGIPPPLPPPSEPGPGVAGVYQGWSNLMDGFNRVLPGLGDELVAAVRRLG